MIYPPPPPKPSKEVLDAQKIKELSAVFMTAHLSNPNTSWDAQTLKQVAKESVDAANALLDIWKENGF